MGVGLDEIQTELADLDIEVRKVTLHIFNSLRIAIC